MFKYHLGKCNKEELEREILFLNDKIKELRAVIDHVAKEDQKIGALEIFLASYKERCSLLQEENDMLCKEINKLKGCDRSEKLNEGLERGEKIMDGLAVMNSCEEEIQESIRSTGFTVPGRDLEGRKKRKMGKS